VYCRSGVSTQETGPVSGADSISWSTQLLQKNNGVNILLLRQKNYFSVKVLTYWTSS
jgi:hypothetical protein